MKVAQRKQGKSSQKPSSFSSFWLIGSIVLGVLTCLRSAWWRPSSLDDQDVSIIEDVETDERFSHVRSNLFAKDGSMQFSSEKLVQAFHSENPEQALSSLYAERGQETSRFGTTEYWDQRYAKADNPFDWFGTWNSGAALRIKPTVDPWLPAQVSSVLNLGCGNSRLAEELYSDGYRSIMNVDISQVVIDKMRRKFGDHTGLEFRQMDITNMTFVDNSFDVIFDKGTLDAVYFDVELVKLAVPQIFRVLKPGGLFVSMSFGSPVTRSQLNATSGDGEAAGWDSFRTTVMDREGQLFYLYTMTK